MIAVLLMSINDIRKMQTNVHLEGRAAAAADRNGSGCLWKVVDLAGLQQWRIGCWLLIINYCLSDLQHNGAETQPVHDRFLGNA